MFGLPMTTTVILLVISAFWIIYTLVFYFSTSNWAIEDDDYAQATSDAEAPAGTVAHERQEGDSR